MFLRMEKKEKEWKTAMKKNAQHLKFRHIYSTYFAVCDIDNSLWIKSKLIVYSWKSLLRIRYQTEEKEKKLTKKKVHSFPGKSVCRQTERSRTLLLIFVSGNFIRFNKKKIVTLNQINFIVLIDFPCLANL